MLSEDLLPTVDILHHFLLLTLIILLHVDTHCVMYDSNDPLNSHLV